MSLTQKHCVPCEGGTAPLTAPEIEKYLSVLQNEWQLAEAEDEASGATVFKIEYEFAFKNFKEALAFINKVGGIAEAEGHHPDLFLHDYKKVTVLLWTHAIKGLSENDFIMAAKIEQLYLADTKG